MLLLGLALFISLLLRYFSDFLRLQSRSKFIITSLHKIVFLTVAVISTDNLWHVFYLIKLSGDIKENSGPKLSSSQKRSICHWNLNSIAAHNFTKVSLLIAHNSIHKYDIMFVWNVSWFKYSPWWWQFRNSWIQSCAMWPFF